MYQPCYLVSCCQGKLQKWEKNSFQNLLQFILSLSTGNHRITKETYPDWVSLFTVFCAHPTNLRQRGKTQTPNPHQTWEGFFSDSVYYENVTPCARAHVLIGERPNEGVGDHLDDGLGGEHDAHLHVLLRQLLVPLQLGQVLPDE